MQCFWKLGCHLKRYGFSHRFSCLKMTNFWDLGDPKFQTPEIERDLVFANTTCVLSATWSPHVPTLPTDLQPGRPGWLCCNFGDHRCQQGMDIFWGFLGVSFADPVTRYLDTPWCPPTATWCPLACRNCEGIWELHFSGSLVVDFQLPKSSGWNAKELWTIRGIQENKLCNETQRNAL